MWRCSSYIFFLFLSFFIYIFYKFLLLSYPLFLLACFTQCTVVYQALPQQFLCFKLPKVHDHLMIYLLHHPQDLPKLRIEAYTYNDSYFCFSFGKGGSNSVVEYHLGKSRDQNGCLLIDLLLSVLILVWHSFNCLSSVLSGLWMSLSMHTAIHMWIVGS